MKTPMIHPGLIELPYSLAGRIYRSPLPFSPMFDPRGQILPAFARHGVDTIVVLNETEELYRLTGQDLLAHYRQLGYAVIHAPAPDFGVFQPEVLQAALEGTLAAARAGQTVAIHCHAGIGRTGILTASLASVVFKLAAEDAIAWVRQFIPAAVENGLQYQFVLDFNRVGN